MMKLIVMITAILCFIGVTVYAEMQQDVINRDVVGSAVNDYGLFLLPVNNGDGYQVNSSDGTKNATWAHDGTNAVFDTGDSGSIWQFGVNGVPYVAFGGNFTLRNSSCYRFSSTSLPTGSADTTLCRGAAGAIDVTDTLRVGDGLSTAPSYSFVSDPDTGYFRTASGTTRIIGNTTNVVEFGASPSIKAHNLATLGWSSSGITGAADLILVRDAANTLALRNGTSAQVLNIYDTYTDTSNYERGSIGFGSNIFRINTSSLGTGGTQGISLAIEGVDQWIVSTAGTLRPAVDNTEILGSDTIRPATTYTYDLDVKEKVILQPQALTIPDNTVGASKPSNTTTEITKSTIRIDCQDPDGCNFTLAETNAIDGQQLNVISVGANAIDLIHTAGVMELNSDSNLNLPQYEGTMFEYVVDRWIWVSW